MLSKEFFDILKHLVTFSIVVMGVIAVRFILYMPQGITEEITQALPF